MHAALRVLEVRVAYCEEDFEYDQLQRLARKVRLSGDWAWG